VRPVDEVQFREWAQGRQPALRRTAFLLCGDWHHAQDLVQETLTRLYKHWPRLSDRDGLDAYARKVLVRAYTDERRRRRSTERPTAAIPDVPDRSGEESRADLRLTLLAALGRMPRSQRAVLVLRYWEDLTQAQTAAVLGCSEGNVKSQAARGLTALRAELDRVGFELTAPGRGPAGALSEVWP
jgi:RNA polymerase sigma-70 factor (sigma-E family)